MPDLATRAAMRWLYDQHGLRTEPSGAIGVAVLLGRLVDPSGSGDLVVVLSGRNVDDDAFVAWIRTGHVKSLNEVLQSEGSVV